MEYDIKGVSERIKGLRETMNYSTDYVAQRVGVSKDEYEKIESGCDDFSITFLYKIAELYGVDLIEVLTGDNPKLNKYTIVRNGKGLPIERREKFTYQHMAYLFKNKSIEPLVVTAPYEAENEEKPVSLSSHDGQEFDYIISGSLKFVIDGKTEVLNEGDAVYYNSETPHGMVSTGKKECKFLAILIKK